MHSSLGTVSNLASLDISCPLPQHNYRQSTILTTTANTNTINHTQLIHDQQNYTPHQQFTAYSCKYQRTDITNVVLTQQAQSSCENHTLDDLWFSSILQLGNYYITEQRTENIRLKCKRYCLGQAVIMKLLRMQIICKDDTTQSWIHPPHNGLLDIYSTQTCHVRNMNHSLT